MKRISAFLLMCLMSCVVVAAQNTQDDVREAVFRWQFENNKAGVPKGAKFFCLQLNGGDPTTAFMNRFKGYRTPVKKISACNTSGGGVSDAKTGQFGGVVFKVEDGMMSNDEALFTGGYYFDGLGASGNQYTVRKIKGKWKVVEDRITFIS